MWPTTRVSQTLKITFPIIQAPMAGGLTTPELVAAVSNAGGLGSLGAGYLSPADIHDAIKRIRQLTAKPFAVNLFIPNQYTVTPNQLQAACHAIDQSCSELSIHTDPIKPPYTYSFEDQLNVVLEEQVPIFSFTFGLLDLKWISLFKQINTVIIGTATTLAEACALEESGVDVIVAQGREAGGHRGTFMEKPEQVLIDLFHLVPQLADQIKVPIIAAGGIMDGQRIADALRLGAAGVQMGTAFLTSYESGADKHYKQALLSQQKDTTTLTRAFSGKLARGIENQFITRMRDKKAAIADYPIQNALTRSMRAKAKEAGNIEFMSLWAGQSAHLCKAMGAAEFMQSLTSEAESK